MASNFSGWKLEDGGRTQNCTTVPYSPNSFFRQAQRGGGHSTAGQDGRFFKFPTTTPAGVFSLNKKTYHFGEKKDHYFPPQVKKTNNSQQAPEKKRWKKEPLWFKKHMHGFFVLQKHPTSPKPFAAKRHGSPPPRDLFSIDATIGKFQAIRGGRLRHVDRHDVDGLRGWGVFFVAGR